MRGRFKLQLLLIAIVCLGPVVGAYLLYYYGDLSALPLVPNEERLLLNPAVPLPPVDGLTAESSDDSTAWGPQWTLLYVRTSECDDVCHNDLVRIARVHVRLGREQSRVRMAYLGPDPGAFLEEPTLDAASIETPSAEALVTALAAAGAPVTAGGRLYVVDPHGNLVLSYPPHPDQEGLLDDLDRLLDVSRIG